MATFDIHPRADGEGSIGHSSFHWLWGRFKNLLTGFLQVTFVDSDLTPYTTGTRSLGTTVKKWLAAHITTVNASDVITPAITLGGVQRTAWPEAGTGTQSMDDVYNNGTAVAVDNTNVLWNMTIGKIMRWMSSTGESAPEKTYFSIEEGAIAGEAQVYGRITNSRCNGSEIVTY